MCLLIDIGNTRLKWGVKHAHGIRSGQAFNLENQPLNRCFERAWNNLEQPTRVIAANVAGAAIADQLSRWIRLQWNLSVEFAHTHTPAHGVRVAYSDPAKLGADRWVCLLALRHLYQLPACVVDCGTAITLDVLDKTGMHRGGVIMPGLALMHSSLLRGTCDIAESGGAGRVGLADNTGAAIRSGTVFAAAGMVEKALNGLDESLSLVATGGDALSVTEQISLPAVVVPDLVLQGLAVMI